MENNAKTREPLDDDALGEVAGGKVTHLPGGWTSLPTLADTAGTGDSGGWRCKQCGGTHSGPASEKPDKCIYCGGELVRVL